MAEILPSTFSAVAAYSAATDGGTGAYPSAVTNSSTLGWARDGDNKTSDTFYGTVNSASAFISFDLGASVYVDHINILHTSASASGGWGATYTNGRALQYSDDGSSWTTAASLSGHSDASDTTSVTYNVAATHRYWRVSYSGYIAIGEIRFYDLNGVASAAGIGALAATGKATANSPAAAAGVGALTATGKATANSPAAAAGVGVLTATGKALANSPASAAGIGDLSATGVAVFNASASASATGGLAATGASVFNAAASASATGALAASSASVVASPASASATGALAASSASVAASPASATAAGDVSAVGASQAAGAGVAAGVGNVAAVAQTDGSPATLAGVGGLAAVGASTAAGVVSVSAAGGLSVVGLAVSEGAATMAAGGVLAARAPLTPGPTYIIGRRPGAFSVGAAAGVVTIGARRAWRPQR